MDSSSSTPARPCLWCAAPLPEPLEPTTRCTRCGRGNRRDDLATYRTLNPRARRLQTGLEVAAALTLGICFFAAVVNWRHLKGGDPRVHWSILGPAILAFAVGYWSRFITHRRVPRRLGWSPLSCGMILLVLAAYWMFLALSQDDLQGGTLYAALALAGIVVGLMGIRLWRVVRRT